MGEKGRPCCWEPSLVHDVSHITLPRPPASLLLASAHCVWFLTLEVLVIRGLVRSAMECTSRHVTSPQLTAGIVSFWAYGWFFTLRRAGLVVGHQLVCGCVLDGWLALRRMGESGCSEEVLRPERVQRAWTCLLLLLWGLVVGCG